MCGLVGYFDMGQQYPPQREILVQMTKAIQHRGPDANGYYLDEVLGLGFRRLSIIDLENGQQPMYNENQDLVLVCNGEIYNYKQLRQELIQKGHVFQTNCDVEVLLHLYEEKGLDLLQDINGQFAFAIYDKRQRRLFLARDHFGIIPLHYTIINQVFIFASEIKALLKHPLVSKEVDLTGLDQILSFPGLIPPRTLFKGISSCKEGHALLVADEQVKVFEYWDLNYPQLGELPYDKQPEFYVDNLRDLFFKSVVYRLQSDVPVGLYLSGGLDSSVMAAAIKRLAADRIRKSLSITFPDEEINETYYQQLITNHLNLPHQAIDFSWSEIAERLVQMVYHCESPVKETFNTCSLALSEAAQQAGIVVILAGEGADELFAGYVGYRFDQFGNRAKTQTSLEAMFEQELQEQLWGDRHLFYEKNQYAFREIKQAFYATDVNEQFSHFDCLNFHIVDQSKLVNRHFIHQRSYLDFKLRLSEHLLSEHGDRMAMAHSVEARYPFLDIDLVNFAQQIPPDLKLNGLSEKHIVKLMAQNLVPEEIIRREKFGFRAPTSAYVLKQNIVWVQDMLSYNRIKRQGYLNADVIEYLKTKYLEDDFTLNPHNEVDLLMIALSFSIFLDVFEMPNFS